MLNTSPNSLTAFSNKTKQCVNGFYYLNPMVLVYQTASKKDHREKGHKNGSLGIVRGGGAGQWK